MGMKTMERQTVVGQWYTSTTDGWTQGKVIAVTDNSVKVQLNSGQIEECFGFEFGECWE